MTRTSLAPWARGLPPAKQYDEEGKPVPTYRYVGAAAGGWYTSARDMAGLLLGYHRIHERRGRSLPFSAALLAQIATPGVPVVLDGKEIAGARYGLGHAVSVAGGDTLYYHSGGNPGSRAYLIVSPKRGLGLFVATNSDHGVPLIIELRRLWGDHYRVVLPPLF
jgi:CubicO group peptidase (beta-lactamase class C family)